MLPSYFVLYASEPQDNTKHVFVKGFYSYKEKYFQHNTDKNVLVYLYQKH